MTFVWQFIVYGQGTYKYQGESEQSLLFSQYIEISFFHSLVKSSDRCGALHTLQLFLQFIF